MRRRSDGAVAVPERVERADAGGSAVSGATGGERGGSEAAADDATGGQQFGRSGDDQSSGDDRHPDDDRYTVRPFEPADERAFRSLFEAVLGEPASEEWFEWKYRANPYVDHVPIFLAETDGEVVGARAFFSLELRADGSEYVAFQPCDTMVHPDHRRRGLFTRMTEAAIDRYADDVDCFFNFPNEYSLAGNLKLGWEVVGERETYYRVQNPATWLSDALPGDSSAVGATVGSAAWFAGRAAARSYLSVRDRLAPDASGVAPRWHDGVPAELLASLAGKRTPREFRVPRDERFYRWRFENPKWEYETVVARDGATPDRGNRDETPAGKRGDPTAAIVVGTRTYPDGTSVAQFADVVPLVGGADRERALSALVAAAVRRHADADLLLAPGETVPESLLSAYGFHGDGRPPLSWVASPTVQVARPVADDGEWTLADRSLAEAENWRLALCEQDSG
ncbi:GNAT family N-acetyltransferase [Halorussus limi]|uniref:GNAT family N-acetyltransferase n=1 Tax=Halorussus limi TaxID=2938695 RepID=A0A8U0HY26_9EURY|nr:GNAT family N-acetyltransferase [Halorussus limi]UPV75990.1 GNAT family N-acetyltransferase [Halorussus limi]